jgi:hypothetical protein
VARLALDAFTALPFLGPRDPGIPLRRASVPAGRLAPLPVGPRLTASSAPSPHPPCRESAAELRTRASGLRGKEGENYTLRGVHHRLLPFGNPADPVGPVALRPRLAVGLPLLADKNRMTDNSTVVQGCRCPLWAG